MVSLNSTNNNIKIINKLVLEDFKTIKEINELNQFDHNQNQQIELFLKASSQSSLTTSSFSFLAFYSLYNLENNIFYVIFKDKIIYTDLSPKKISNQLKKPIKWIEKKIKNEIINKIFKYCSISDKLIIMDINNNLLEII